MKLLSYGTCASLLALHLVGCSAAQEEKPIRWETSIPLGIEEAGTGQPIFVYFGANWCTVCARMDHETFRSPEVVRAMNGYIPVKVDVDAQPRTAAHYGASAVPAFLIVERSGVVRARTAGYLSGSEMSDFLSASEKELRGELHHGQVEEGL
jgi:thiol:disulfide interchange protein